MKTIKQLMAILILSLLTSCSVQYRATTPLYYDPIYYPYYYQPYTNYWGDYYWNNRYYTQPYYAKPYMYYSKPSQQIRPNTTIQQRRPNTTNRRVTSPAPKKQVKTNRSNSSGSRRK